MAWVRQRSGESPDPTFEHVCQKLLQPYLLDALGALSDRQAGIVMLRHGLVDGEPKTLAQIGMVYGVTRERIRQIESMALKLLRNSSLTEPLRIYYDN